MVNRIRKIYARGLNKRFDSKFRVDPGVRHETPKEDRRVHRPKVVNIAIKMKTFVQILQILKLIMVSLRNLRNKF